jgi:hypothetical protein
VSRETLEDSEGELLPHARPGSLSCHDAGEGFQDPLLVIA